MVPHAETRQGPVIWQRDPTELEAMFSYHTPMYAETSRRWLAKRDLWDEDGAWLDWICGTPQPHGLGMWFGPVEQVLGAASVRAHGDGLFEIDEAGRAPMAVLQPVEQASGEIVDLIAWHPAAPDKWRSLRGDAEILGASAIDGLRFEDELLRIYETPLSWWHSHEPNKVCFLSWRPSVIKNALMFDDGLWVESESVADRLDVALSHWRVPTYYGPSKER